jgi:hypothetical protein
MPIIGKINAQKIMHRICTLLVGDRGYLAPEDFCVTAKGTLIHVDSQVFSKEELEKEQGEILLGLGHPNPTQHYVRITRVGKGLTEHDFELDFRNLSPDIIFEVHGPIRYLTLTRDSADEYIVFTDGKLDFEVQIAKPIDIRTLKEQLDDALEVFNYELAAKIRDQIKKEEGKK